MPTDSTSSLVVCSALCQPAGLHNIWYHNDILILDGVAVCVEPGVLFSTPKLKYFKIASVVLLLTIEICRSLLFASWPAVQATCEGRGALLQTTFCSILLCLWLVTRIKLWQMLAVLKLWLVKTLVYLNTDIRLMSDVELLKLYSCSLFLQSVSNHKTSEFFGKPKVNMFIHLVGEATHFFTENQDSIFDLIQNDGKQTVIWN